MKRIFLILSMLLATYSGFSNSFFTMWAGAGVATRYNYDLGLSYGVSYVRAATYRVGIGAHLFTQQYNLYYDKENRNLVGASVRNNSNYFFVSPTIDFHIGPKGNTHFYLNAGGGFNIGASDTLRKWDREGFGMYDSTIGKAENINKTILRIGMGLQHYISINRRCYMSISEDIGFLPGRISETNDPTNARLNSNVNRIFKPTYISLRIGIGWRHVRKG